MLTCTFFHNIFSLHFKRVFLCVSSKGDKTNDLMAKMTRFISFFKSTDDVVSAPCPMCVWIPYVSMEMMSVWNPGKIWSMDLCEAVFFSLDTNMVFLVQGCTFLTTMYSNVSQLRQFLTCEVRSVFAVGGLCPRGRSQHPWCPPTGYPPLTRFHASQGDHQNYL